MTDKSFFDWIGACLLQDCGLPPEPWQRQHADAAVSVFADEALQRAATVLAVLHPFVLDYIRQAPVLVVAAAGETAFDVRKRADRVALAKRFIAKAGPLRRLPAVLKAYGVSPPLKKLHGELLSPHHARLLPALALQPDVVLAQVVPTDRDPQREWLYWARHTIDRLQGARRRPSPELAWCLAHLNTAERRENTVELIDWMTNMTGTFNPKVRYDEAHAASLKWHEDQAARLARHRFAPDGSTLRVVDYQPLPAQWSGDGLTFKAITTYAALDEESARMHHCVRTYWPRMLDGTSRIYSVRRQGARIATLELGPVDASAHETRLRVAQLRGYCNARVAADVVASATAFCAAANAAAEKAAAVAAEQAAART